MWFVLRFLSVSFVTLVLLCERQIDLCDVILRVLGDGRPNQIDLDGDVLQFHVILFRPIVHMMIVFPHFIRMIRAMIS